MKVFSILFLVSFQIINMAQAYDSTTFHRARAVADRPLICFDAKWNRIVAKVSFEQTELNQERPSIKLSVFNNQKLNVNNISNTMGMFTAGPLEISVDGVDGKINKINCPNWEIVN